MFDDHTYMRLAIEQAHQAREVGEVPVGAVIVDPAGHVVATGYNRTIIDHDPTAHAEMIALRAAGHERGNHRLPGLTLYVTLEPCVMCLGAAFHARLSRIVYGASDPKTGACESLLQISDLSAINHHTSVSGGVLAQDCANQLRAFFSDRRAAKKQEAMLKRGHQTEAGPPSDR